jgi:predicted MFS family arabinose efflux permease
MLPGWHPCATRSIADGTLLALERIWQRRESGAKSVMLAMILVAVGSVGAATGFTLIGTSMAIIGGNDLMTDISWVLMIGGVIMAVLGGLWYRSNEHKLEQERLRAR